MRPAVWVGLALCACEPVALDDDVINDPPVKIPYVGLEVPRDRALHPDLRDVPPNILIVLLDDIGTDALSTYGEQPDAPHTPVLDGLAAQGVLFRNVWAAPTCSPARAALLTGRYATRTGVGGVTQPITGAHGLPLAETTLAELLQASPHGWATEALGKWHLATPDVGGIDHPNLQGFDHFRGAMGNLSENHAYDGAVSHHSNFEKVVDGVGARAFEFSLVDEVNDAVTAVTTLPQPWFVYLATHAAHGPYQVPPEELLGGDLPDPTSLVEVYRSMVRASDAELGRLMASVDLARTVVIVAGDNGTPPEATVEPFRPELAKKSFGEGGLGVPMIVLGAGVSGPGREVATPVHFVDIFPTVAELARVSAEAWPVIDGESLVPWLRSDGHDADDRVIYADIVAPNGPDPAVWFAAVRDLRWKYLRSSTGIEAFFDLEGRDFELKDLLPEETLDEETSAALARLRDELSLRRASFVAP